MCQIRKVISIFVPFKGNKRILNGLFYPILRLNSPSEIERVCSGICTGGKKDEGPNYETLAKIILHPIEDGIQSHTVHYNRIQNLTELQYLIKDEYKELLESCKAKLTNENEYTFEY